MVEEVLMRLQETEAHEFKLHMFAWDPAGHGIHSVPFSVRTRWYVGTVSCG
jgi:hypothetical protein